MTSADSPPGTPLPSSRLSRHRDVEREARIAVPGPVSDGPRGVVFITGMPGAGKTAVARALARSFILGAHIEEDWVWWWLTMSGATGAGDDDEFKRPRGRVFMRHVGSLVDNFAAEGFVPIVEGAIMRRSWLVDRMDRIRTRPVRLVVLFPADRTSRTRDASRSGITFYRDYPNFENSLVEEFGGSGLWVDSDRLSLEETVASIRDHLDAALLDGWD